MGKDSELGAGNSRVARLVRFLRTLPEGSHTGRLDVREGDDWSTQLVLHPLLEKHCTDVSETVQALADEAATQIRARLVVELEGGREVLHSMRGNPGPDVAMTLPGGDFEGSQVSQVQQAQRHVEALVRLSVQERTVMLRSMESMLTSQAALLERCFERLGGAHEEADRWREELHQLREALLQEDEEADTAQPIPPQIEALLQLVAGAAAKRMMTAPPTPKRGDEPKGEQGND